MHTSTGDVVELPEGTKPSPEYIQVNEIVEIKGLSFRVTGMKLNGRVYLKLIKPKKD